MITEELGVLADVDRVPPTGAPIPPPSTGSLVHGRAAHPGADAAGMVPLQPLPASLRDRPFTVTEALERGVSRSRLKAADLTAPHPGVRVPAHLATSLDARAGAALLALPQGSALSGRTAVELLGLPLPAGLPSHDSRPIEAVVPVVATEKPDVRGIRTHHGDVAGRTLLRRGLRMVHPRHLWIELAAEWGFVDAVALGDAVRFRWASGQSMAAAVAEHAGHRGVVRARRVLASVRYRVESPMETRARLLFLSRGLPEPGCGDDVVENGEWLGRADLRWVDARVIVEFDGDQHRTDRRQWQLDLTRRRMFEAAGWKVIVFTAHDLQNRRDDLVATVAAALRAGGLTW